MANNSSRTLKLIFAGDNKGAVRSVDGLGKSLGGLEGKLGGVGAGLAGAFSVGAITAGATKAIQGWQQQGLAVAQVKRLTGESAENASLMSFAAQQSGIDATKASVGWRFLAKNIENGKVAAEGIKTKGVNGELLPFEKILGNVADKIKSLPPGVERTALALKLFGRGGADMVKILSRGSDGIEALRGEMQKYGLEFSDAKLKQIQKFVETQRDLQAVAGGVEVAIGSKLAPAVQFAEEQFVKLPGPIRTATAEASALVATVGAVALGVGALGPVLSRGLVTLRLRSAATVEAADADVALVAADLSAADAETALATAWATGVPLAGEAAVAREALAASSAAEAGAAEGAAVANGTLAASLGPITLGIAAAVAVYKGLQQSLHGGTFHIPVLDPKLLGGTNKQLALAASRLAQIGKLGADPFKGQNLTVLRRMQAAIEATGGKSIPQLDKAVQSGERSAARAAAAEKRYGQATDDAAAAVNRKEKALRRTIKAEEALNKKVSDAVSKATQERDAQQGVIDAHQQTLDDEKALADAQKAAVGNSDEYRSALDDIASAKQDAAAAADDVTSAQEDENKAEADARQHLSDLADATIKATQARRDATLALHQAQFDERRTLADPRSSALDKEAAQVALADATDNANQASKDAVSAAKEEADARRAGIEGDKGVVDAKKKVADAQDKVRESIGKVGLAQAAARKILHDAADEARADSAKVQTDKAAEAKAEFELIGLTKDATAAALIYYALLKQMGADPTLQRLLLLALGGVNSGLLQPVGQGELPGRPQGAPHAPGEPGRAAPTRSLVTINQIHQGTPRQVAKASAAAATRSIDRFFQGTR